MSNFFTICKGKAAFDSGEEISEHCQGGTKGSRKNNFTF